MTTLIAYYSKSGNSRQVALRLAKKLGAPADAIAYDAAARSIAESAANPADFERVILVCPIWAFSLPEPMSLYLKRHKDALRHYSLIVTCMIGGLAPCVRACGRIVGRRPDKSLKIKGKAVAGGDYDLGGFLE
jgi:hypothetical protein